MNRTQRTSIATLAGTLMGGNLDDIREALEAALPVLGSDKGAAVVIERASGAKLVIPEDADYDAIIDAVAEQRDRETQEVEFFVDIPVSPWDGAYALQEAMKSELGVVAHKGCRNGCCPPKQIDVEVGLGQTVSIPWGRFVLTTLGGATIQTNTTVSKDERRIFQCIVECERRYESRIRRMFDKLKEIVATSSLHKGKAFSVAFYDAAGKPIEMPQPSFFPFSEEEPIFDRALTNSIERNVLIPIKHIDALAAAGEPTKFGVAIVGDYGVGKTLLANYIAKIATAQGWTFIYVKNSAELPEAWRFAQQYQPAVVFAEDIDRVAGLERTDGVNKLMNQLDGIDGKAVKMITVVTSNHADKINLGMRRPGRINLTLEVKAPDAETVGRMIQSFAGSILEENTDLSEAQAVLAGQVPARVREAVSRARREALRRTGEINAKITGADLAQVGEEIKAEVLLFKAPEVDHRDHHVVAAVLDAAATSLRNGNNGQAHHKREVAHA